MSLVEKLYALMIGPLFVFFENEGRGMGLQMFCDLNRR